MAQDNLNAQNNLDSPPLEKTPHQIYGEHSLDSLGAYGKKLLENRIQEQHNRKELYDILPEHTRKVIDQFAMLKDMARTVATNKRIAREARVEALRRQHLFAGKDIRPEPPTIEDESRCCPDPPRYTIFDDRPAAKQGYKVWFGGGYQTPEEHEAALAEGVPYMLKTISRQERQAVRDSLFTWQSDENRKGNPNGSENG